MQLVPDSFSLDAELGNSFRLVGGASFEIDGNVVAVEVTVAVTVAVDEFKVGVAGTQVGGRREGQLEGVCCDGFLASPAIMATGRPPIVTLVEREFTKTFLRGKTGENRGKI